MTTHVRPSLCSLLGVLVIAGTARAQGSIDVKHYRIEVDIADNDLDMKVAIRARAKSLPKKWRLDLAGRMKVVKATVAGEALPVAVTRGGIELDLAASSSLGKGIGKGDFTVELALSGSPYLRFSRGGYVRTQVSKEITHIRSQYPWYPRVAGDPATFEVIVRTRADWLVRTAGTAGRPQVANGRATWTFRRDKPTRGIGLVAGPYRAVEIKGRDGFVLDARTFAGHEKGARLLLGISRSAFDYYTRLFGAVEEKRFTLVEMPRSYGAGSGYGEAGYVLIGTGAFTAAGEAPWADSLVAHEVSHTWWGEAVGFTHFASESLACYATLRFLEHSKGADVARHERGRAIDRILAATALGKEIAFADIRSWGSGMDGTTYRAHAYEKGMMLLVMLEQAVGRQVLDRCLVRLFAEQRGKVIDYALLRGYLAKCGKDAKVVLAQWERPGIPTLELSHEVKRAGKRFKIAGVLSQTGTKRPFRMSVDLVVVCVGKDGDDELVRRRVKLAGTKKKFSFTVPGKVKSIRIDPDRLLVVKRPRSGPLDPATVVSAEARVFNNPNEADPVRLRQTIVTLTAVLDQGAGDRTALCYTGIGRCQFRQGEHDKAIAAFKRALSLGAGGPFHRAWIYLRLGCIADLRKDRSAARRYYEKAVAQGRKYLAARRAAKYLDRPYPGYAKSR